MNDFISREAMLTDLRAKLTAMKEVHLSDNAKIAERMINYVLSFPSAEINVEKRGKWMYGDTDYIFTTEIYCPFCGKPALYPDEEDDDSIRPLETLFCPHCGALLDNSVPYDKTWPFYDMSLKQKLKKQEKDKMTEKGQNS